MKTVKQIKHAIVPFYLIGAMHVDGHFVGIHLNFDLDQTVIHTEAPTTYTRPLIRKYIECRALQPRVYSQLTRTQMVALMKFCRSVEGKLWLSTQWCIDNTVSAFAVEPKIYSLSEF